MKELEDKTAILTEVARDLGEGIALECMGTSERVAKTVAFLFNGGAGFIRGEDILVAGGRTKLCRL